MGSDSLKINEMIFVDCEEYIPPEIFKGMLDENGKMLEELYMTYWNPIIERAKNSAKNDDSNNNYLCHRILDLLEPIDESVEPKIEGSNLIISTFYPSYARVFQEKGFHVKIFLNNNEEAEYHIYLTWEFESNDIEDGKVFKVIKSLDGFENWFPDILEYVDPGKEVGAYWTKGHKPVLAYTVKDTPPPDRPSLDDITPPPSSHVFMTKEDIDLIKMVAPENTTRDDKIYAKLPHNSCEIGDNRKGIVSGFCLDEDIYDENVLNERGYDINKNEKDQTAIDKNDDFVIVYRNEVPESDRVLIKECEETLQELRNDNVLGINLGEGEENNETELK